MAWYTPDGRLTQHEMTTMERYKDITIYLNTKTCSPSISYLKYNRVKPAQPEFLC